MLHMNGAIVEVVPTIPLSTRLWVFERGSSLTYKSSVGAGALFYWLTGALHSLGLLRFALNDLFSLRRR
jgi:hypothetical protein